MVVKYLQQSTTFDDYVMGIKHQSYIGSLLQTNPIFCTDKTHTQHLHVPILVFIDTPAQGIITIFITIQAILWGLSQ